MYFSTTIHVDDSATHRQTLMERGRADLIIWSSSSIDQSASHAFSLLKIFQCYYSIISRGLFAADKSQPNSHILWEWHVRWQCEDLSQLLHLLLLLISSNKMKILFSSFFGLCLGNLWLWCWEWWWQCASYLVGHKLLLGWVAFNLESVPAHPAPAHHLHSDAFPYHISTIIGLVLLFGTGVLTPTSMAFTTQFDMTGRLWW